jgi:hypothetical protein
LPPFVWFKASPFRRDSARHQGKRFLPQAGATFRRE